MGRGQFWERDTGSLTIGFLEDSSRFLAYFYRLRCDYLDLFLLTMHSHACLKSADISKQKANLSGERH